MKNHTLKHLLFALSFLMLIGCTKDQDADSRQLFEIAEKDLYQNFSFEKADIYIAVETTLADHEWSVSTSAPDWCLVVKEKKNQSIRLHLPANKEVKAREAIIEIKSTLKNHTIKVTQLGYGKAIELTKGNTASLSNKGGELSVNVLSNMEYDIIIEDGCDWIHPKQQLRSKALAETTHYFTVSSQQLYNERVASISFVDKEDPSFKATYTITQQANEGKASDVIITPELETSLSQVFANGSCTSVKSGVTTEQINKLPGYFALLAFDIINQKYDSYEKHFRIRSVKPYSDPTMWANKLRTKSYTTLDNPTGIIVEAEEEIIVLVEQTHGHTLSLQVIEDTEAIGKSYPLKQGVNKIKIAKKGMLYVLYNMDLEQADAKLINIHIPPRSGSVSGYFDLECDKTDTKYAEYIAKATYKYFAIKGENMMIYFHTDKLKLLMPNQIVNYINLWDHIVSWQHELMGIDNVRPKYFNNHLSAVSVEEGYMWASGNQMGFGKDALPLIMPEDKMQTDRMSWGPAHEIGHMHQGAIAWTGCFESSNNLFSNYVLQKIGKECSNGETVESLALARLKENKTWVDIGSADSHYLSIHMRFYWQLWIYFHQCGIKNDFWPRMFEILRERPESLAPGKQQLEFVRYACDVAQMNLLEFFEIWGLFAPINRIVDQYGKAMYTVTPEMVEEVKRYVEAKNYPKAAPFHFIEDRKSTDKTLESIGLKGKIGDVGYWTQFKEKPMINKNISYSRSGQSISITNGTNAVGFEVYNNNKMIYFSNSLSFDVPQNITLDNNVIVKAVQADGVRVTINKV